MSATISMPLRTNPYIGADMNDPGQRGKFIDWMRGANHRYAHIPKALEPSHPIYMEGYNSTLPNGELTK